MFRRSRLWAVGLLLATACSHDPKLLKQKYVASGDQYFAQQKYAEAIVEYRNAVAQDGRDGLVRLKLGDAYYKVGNLPETLGEYVRAADLLPDNVAAQLAA